MKQLFQKGYIGNCLVKNRVVMTSLTTGFAGLDHEPSEQSMAYYEERAKGGVGLIITDVLCLDQEDGVFSLRSMYAGSPAYTTPLTQLTTRVQKHGAKIFAQLHHGGSANMPDRNDGKIYAPGNIANVSGIPPIPLTVEKLKLIQKQFITSAVFCQKSGFDGVNIHGAHGYLINQFLSASSNNREDEYGGSVENRCRFLTEIIQGIKAACGPEYPVIVRLSVCEYDPHEGSIQIEEGAQIAKIIEAAGADGIDVSNGNYFNSIVISEPPSYASGWKSENIRAVKNAVNVPVIAVNVVKEPEFAEQMLEDGLCDFVGVTRGNVADPQWAKKAKNGQSDQIRKCLSCCYCFESMMNLGHVRCAVNPRMGRETALKEAPVKNGAGRPVVVIGGGPAGMQAATVLAERGFAVTLFEQSGQLGGQLNLADKTAPYKYRITWLIETMTKEMERAGVDVRMNTTATVELVQALAPVGVFLAMGGKQIHPNLSGLDMEHVIEANDIVSGTVQVSGKVAIIGSGLVGLETAELVLTQGQTKDVTVVDMLPKIGQSIFPSILWELNKHLTPFAPTYLPSHKLESVDDAGLHLVKMEDNSPVTVNADYVVLALGTKPVKATVTPFLDAFERVEILGENKQAPGRIANSIADGYLAAYGFDPEN